MKPTLEELAAQHAARRLPQKKRNQELRAHGYDPDGEEGKVYRKLLRERIAEDVGKDRDET